MPRRRILIADDDPNIGMLLQASLEDSEGGDFVVVTVSNGLEAVECFRQEPFDLIILDVMMPYVDGFAACRTIRESSDVPIIILTARDGTDDVIHGFELGADDYVTKPFRIRELQARVEAVLRRVEGGRPRAFTHVARVGYLEVDPIRHQVTMDGEEVQLTPVEFELLYFLAARPGEVFDRATLFREVWGRAYEYGRQTNLIDVCVRRLREKIEIDPSEPEYLLTVRGVGYKVEEPC
ncbi:MAG: response regulator transcription factor [Chloroflexia bacterium]|nr:response regulator transcription factor [Chloroflexia bacterium]